MLLGFGLITYSLYQSNYISGNFIAVVLLVSGGLVFTFIKDPILDVFSPTIDTAQNTYVYDRASILTPQEIQNLHSNLHGFKDERDVIIFVVTTPSLNGQPIAAYANALFRHMGIGQAGKNNGLLLLVAPNERRVRFEVGYGLEATLTDIRTKNIIETTILPRFKATPKPDYYSGILSGIQEIKRLYGTITPAHASQRHPTEDDIIPFIIVGLGLVFMVSIACYIITHVNNASRGYSSSSGGIDSGCDSGDSGSGGDSDSGGDSGGGGSDGGW